MDNDLISRSELKKAIKSYADDQYIENEYLGECAIMNIIDNAPAVEPEVYMTGKDYNLYLEGYKQGRKDFEKPQAENALLMDIAHSLAIIADNSTKEGNTQESGNEVLHWVHSEAHRVMCPKCGCRVSINAAYEMNYCFKCGAKLGGIKNE